MIDVRQFDKHGRPIYMITKRQLGDYWRNIVGQYVFWFNHRINESGLRIKWTDDKIKELFHDRNKRLFLNSIDKQFERELKSTKDLTEFEYLEFISMIMLMLTSKNIDMYEYGVV